MSSSRFLIGIDLGTTNSAVSFVDTRAGDNRVRVFEVPQLVAPGEVAPRRQLPSFVYLAGENDLTPRETQLPWSTPTAMAATTRPIVGELARGQGARMASRLIASAKSWLCHPGVDRQAAILPWGAEAGPKLSPVSTQAAILAHIRAAWDHEHDGDDSARFAEQDVIVTVPASFDEAARELTLAAAAAAGCPPVVLLEEPQAAFYAWLERGARAQLRPGQRVLVFDVGGGTTDFTLITVDDNGDEFSRTAVGDHLLLGGDNIDLTLAKIVEQRLTASRGALDVLQWHSLVHACRTAKETLLTTGGDVAPISVAARGSKLVGGTLRDQITRAELEAVLLDGFFPLVAADAPVQRARSGLQEFGLPYANDAAITRHLASFLSRHPGAPIAAVLFNGGAMTPSSLRSRVLEQVARWQNVRPEELAVALPELAVAEGAAYYGLVRRGLAARIRGGTPRTFYVGVEAEGGERLAVCLAAKGLEDGARVELDRSYQLVTNRPVSFRLYSSTSRDDAPGALVPIGDGRADTIDDGSDLLELPPIVTVLRARGRSQVTVRLEVHISELGALEIYCRDDAAGSTEKWKLSFDMRSGATAPAVLADEDENAAPVATVDTDGVRTLVEETFGGAPDRLAGLMKILEEKFDRRDEWSVTNTRIVFDALERVSAQRKRTADHEQRWLNLAGFCLRPGFGAPLDTWRARQMWGVFNEQLLFGKNESNRLGWWIVWRRVAGGLTAGQQEQIYDRLATGLLPNKLQQKKLAEWKPSKQELAEMWRTVASLERLPVALKIKLGDELARRLDEPRGRDDGVNLWALARIGARVPMYGPLNAVVPATKVGEWLGRLTRGVWPDPEKVAFPLAQLGRRTGDRARDIDEATRSALVASLATLPGGARAAVLVEQVVALEAREERVALGDTLPAGLRMGTGS